MSDKELLKAIKKDLLVRGDKDSDGFTVVNLGSTLWSQLCKSADNDPQDEWISVELADDLLKPQCIDEPCNSYCLALTNEYGWLRAMYADGEWYASYCSKIIVDVTHFMIVNKPPQDKE